jgi:hypothetical protein
MKIAGDLLDWEITDPTEVCLGADESADPIAPIDQSPNQMRANEPIRAGHEYGQPCHSDPSRSPVRRTEIPLDSFPSCRLLSAD